ncbi:MAG TPA: isoaspartyl peptidase/L-asparaginase [Vicinamibacterales bacterium]|nr:isoaspartyl peptidase/L-asparaginase [Vicinamibacterales bacterium]
MKRLSFVVVVALLTGSCSSPSTQASQSPAPQAPRWGIVIHTGAGQFTLAGLSERREPMREAMTSALMAGQKVLAGGGTSLNAIQAAIVILEDSPLFNAGKGAVFNHDGKNELDSSIMDGATRRAGAVAGLRHIKNPVLLARLVMEKSPHVMMVGEGAETFAKEQGGIEFVPESYFYTERSWQALQRALEDEKKQSAAGKSSSLVPAARMTYFGTVGAVALDKQGNLAAATSTGGMTNKRFGRVGDSPIIGAGTYANNESCAISSTGHGEYFIRYTVAHDICARVQYRGIGVQAAADAVVQDVLKKAGGEGGVIGMDRAGNVAASFNSTGMSRGYVGEDGHPVVVFTTEDARPLGPQPTK